MKKYKVSIGTPCRENWDEMTITEKGKHCASCNKIVVDFRNMSDEAIIAYCLNGKQRGFVGTFMLTRSTGPSFLPVNKTECFGPL